MEFDGDDERMILEFPLKMNAGQISTGFYRPTGISEHSGLISTSKSGCFVITSSGTARSLGEMTVSSYTAATPHGCFQRGTAARLFFGSTACGLRKVEQSQNRNVQLGTGDR
jgi:hypothetical protein